MKPTPRQNDDSLALLARRNNLKRLCLLRATLLLIASIALIVLVQWFHWPLPTAPLSGILLALTLITLISLWRSLQAQAITEWTLFIQLVIDLIGVGALLYCSGGAGNPFVTWFLVPITIAAATLSRAPAWSITALAIGLYTLLLNEYLPLNPVSHGANAMHHSAMAGGDHLTGMWMSFVLSALLITVFVQGMAAALREREQRLNQIRERHHQDEQLLALAGLAASTAHELGTPLNSLQLLTEELATLSQDDEQRQTIAVMDEQLSICRHTLNKLSNSAREYSDNADRVIPLKQWIAQIEERWQLLRPQQPLTIIWHPQSDADALIHMRPGLQHSVISLINNAADAAELRLQLTVFTDDEQLKLWIEDDGPGLPKQVLQGEAFFSSKADQGLGLGLFLSEATIARYGGQLSWQSPEQGGTRVELTLQLDGDSDV